MAKTDDKLDFGLPAEFLELGRILSEGGLRSPTGRPGSIQINAEQLDILMEGILTKSLKDATIRKLLGLRREVEADRMRIKIVAVLGWQTLRLSSELSNLGDLAAAASDSKFPLTQALLRAKHEIGIMMAEDTLIGVTDTSERNDGLIRKVKIPNQTLEWLSGGKASMGYLTIAKLIGVPTTQGASPDDERATVPQKIPTPRQLYDGIRKRVIGLDSQAEMISSRLIMHMTRAKLLKAGEDPGTPNECWLVIGPPGVGKTHICQVAGEQSGIVFATADGSDLSAEGYVGLSMTDTLRNLLVASKGNVERARYGFLAVDEFTKKARSMGESPVNTVAVQQEALRVISGQSMQLGGRRGWDRPVQFNTIGTCFALMGHCPGLDRMAEKRMGKRRMGFSMCDGDRRSSAWLADSLVEFGLIPELISRLTATIIIPPPDHNTLMVAVSSERGVVDSYNRLLGAHGAMLFLSPSAIHVLADYGMESGGYFRAMKRVISALAGEVIFEDRKGTTMVEAVDIRRAASKADGGSAVLLGSHGQPELSSDLLPDNIDVGLGTGFAG